MNNILKHLEAILETGSIAAASRRLFLSQPALSQYVKRLETEYEIEIFDRSQIPWQLTQEGEKLLESQRQIARIDRECRQFFADRRRLKIGEIRIGSTAYRTATILNPVLSAFKTQYPDVMVKIEEGTTEQIADLAVKGAVDCAFVITEMAPPALETCPVYSETVLVGLPARHPYVKAHPTRDKAPFPEIDFRALDATPFIIMHRGQIFHDYYERLCEKFHVNLPVALETLSILTVPALVATGEGGALIPSTIADDCLAKNVPLYSLGGSLPENQVSLAWKRGRYLSHAVRVFINTALQVLSPGDEMKRKWGFSDVPDAGPSSVKKDGGDS